MAMTSEAPMFQARRNLYGGKCANCGTRVTEGAGFAFKRGVKWQTCCASAACGRALGLISADGAAKVERRELRADGHLLMPYDPNSIGLVRAMPGARWNPDGKFWTVSLKPSDRARVLELAEKLSLKVAPELQEALPEDPVVVEAVDRAKAVGLYNYQTEGVRWLATRDASLLADDMGCGKTAQVLVALPKKVRAIIVTPGAVKYTWRDEAARWRPDLSVRVLQGRQADSSALIPRFDGELVVVNFDILPDDLRLPPLPPKKKGQPKPKRTGKEKPLVAPALAAQLQGITLIVDEAHRCKNLKAARTEKVRELRKLCAARRQFLTGTPLENRPLDLYGLLQVMGCERDVFGGWQGFTRDFNAHQEIVNRKGTTIWVWGSPRPEVPEKLRRVMLRRTKAEVLPDLPPKRHVTVTVECDDEELTGEMDSLWDEFGFDLEVGRLPDFRNFSRLREKLAAARIPALLEMVEDHEEQGVPLVVFSAHRKPVDTLAKREGWLAITGETIDKQAVAREFQTGKYKGVAVTIKAGGVGLTLTHASNAIFVDREWNPAENNQAADRLHRIGQKGESVLYTHLTCDHVLERHIDQLLLRKMELIDGAIEQTLKAVDPEKVRTAEFRPETDDELAARMAARNKAAENAERVYARERVHGLLEREQGKAVGRAREPVELTAELRTAIRNALSYMLARCDGAVSRDSAGFNKADTGIMHMVGATGLDDSDERTFRVAHAILSRYHRQLSDNFPELF